jgi:hypothetical protein
LTRCGTERFTQDGFELRRMVLAGVSCDDDTDGLIGLC